MSFPCFDRDAFFSAFLAAGRHGQHATAERETLIRNATALLDSEACEKLLEECYRTGDTAEKSAVLRCLGQLQHPERCVALAVEACRSNIVPIFEAIACENPFPARYFPEANFNQLVLKALFINISTTRIEGLEQRVNQELHRMLEDFAAERQAAGRPIPPEVPQILAMPACTDSA